jgi:hypothetical protein
VTLPKVAPGAGPLPLLGVSIGFHMIGVGSVTKIVVYDGQSTLATFDDIPNGGDIDFRLPTPRAFSQAISVSCILHVPFPPVAGASTGLSLSWQQVELGTSTS